MIWETIFDCKREVIPQWSDDPKKWTLDVSSYTVSHARKEFNSNIMILGDFWEWAWNQGSTRIYCSEELL